MCIVLFFFLFFFFFKQKTAYEMRISDWSSDVCSSDLRWFDYSEQSMIDAIAKLPSGRVSATSTHDPIAGTPEEGITIKAEVEVDADAEIGRASCRERVCQYV